MYKKNMKKKGCYNGCIYRKDIKLNEMADKYEFRCLAQKRYMTKDDIKLRCSLYEGQIKIKVHTIDEFFL